MKSFILCDLFFGDCSKGSWTNYLTKEHKSQLTVKYCGGSQCSHAVVREDNVYHLFSQFGSGTFHGAETFLSKHFIFNPISLMDEARVLSTKGIGYALNHIHVDERALVTTIYHQTLNRIRELARGKNRHGSVGLGIWETVSDSENRPEEVIRAGDLLNLKHSLDKLRLTQDYCKNEIEKVLSLIDIRNVDIDNIKKEQEKILIRPEDILRYYSEIREHIRIVNKNQAAELLDDKNLVFEPGQGVALDKDFGFAPYVSASTTTTKNAREIIKEFDIQGEKEYIGLGRSYLTRHGDGPLITELDFILNKDKYNLEGQFQGKMRYGIFDIVLAQYVLGLADVDYVALSHLDVVQDYSKWPICREYRGFSYPKFCPTFEQWGELSKQMIDGIDYVVKNVRPDEFIPYIEENLQKKVKFGSFGPKDSQKKVFN